MENSDREATLLKIAKVEKHLANLLKQKDDAEAELRSLREELAISPTSPIRPSKFSKSLILRHREPKVGTTEGWLERCFRQRLWYKSSAVVEAAIAV